MAELADAPDLGSGGLPVQVQVLLPAPGRAWTQAASRARFFYFAFSLAFVAGIYFVTQTHVGAKSALLLFSNCDPLRWVRSWRAALRADFFFLISFLTSPSKKPRTHPRSRISFFFCLAPSVSSGRLLQPIPGRAAAPKSRASRCGVRFLFACPSRPIPWTGCIAAQAKEKAPLKRDFLVTTYRLFPPLWPVPAAAQRRLWGW